MRTLKLQVWGVDVFIRLDPSRHTGILDEVLLPGWRPGPCEPGESERETPDFELSHNGGRSERLLQGGNLVLEGSAREIADRFDQLLHIEIGARSPQAVFVHAGAVGWNGSALIFPGRSMAGKSSLVHALVSAGASFLSDEFAVLTPDGCVHPYPKRLKLRQASGGSRELPLAHVNWAPSQPALPVGGVLALEFDSAVADGPSSLQPASPGEAAMAILANTVSARTSPLSALSVATRISEKTRNFIGPRGEATQTAELILNALFPRSSAALHPNARE